MSFTRDTQNLNIISGLGGSSANNYGCTESEMKAKFDEGAKKVRDSLNGLMDALEDFSAANNIGCNTDLGNNLGDVLNAIIAAGTGTVPPDGSISTAKIQNGAVTSDKLSSAINNLLQRSTQVKMGKLSDYTPTRSEGQTGGDVTVDYYNTYNIGFTPVALIIFDIRPVTIDSGSSYNRDTYYWHLSVDETKYYEYSSYVVETFNNFGGIAFTDSPCIGKGTSSSATSSSTIEVFRVVSNGFRTHIYSAEHEYNSGDKKKWNTAEGKYFIAIGANN